MPVYNNEHYVGMALESIFSQTYNNLEVIVINDGSTDNSLKTIKAFKDERLKIISRKNKGVSATRNEGIQKASGTYIAMHDGDDVSTPDRLQKQINFLIDNPDVGLIGTNLQLINEHGELIGMSNLLTDPDDLKLSEIFSNQIAQGTVMIRRNVLMQTDLYDTSMTHAEDTDLWRRTSHLTMMANLKEPLYKYRVHPEGASADIQKIRSSAMTTSYREFDYYTSHKKEYKLLSFHPNSMLGGFKSYLSRKSHMYRCMAWMYANGRKRSKAFHISLIALLHAPWEAKNYHQVALYLISNTPTEKIEYEFF
jgi:glycosyltransferase involved in cell wall biosynthesis